MSLIWWNLQLTADLFITAECRVIFCFEKEVTFFIETIQCVILEILIYLLFVCNNCSTCFYTN